MTRPFSAESTALIRWMPICSRPKDYSVWVNRGDLSLNPGFRSGSLVIRRSPSSSFVLDTTTNGKSWSKMVIDGYKKGVPSAHWGTYEEAYGTTGGVYLVITTMKGLPLNSTRKRRKISSL